MHPIDTTHVEAAVEAEGAGTITLQTAETALDRVQEHFADWLDGLIQAHFEQGRPYDEQKGAYYFDSRDVDIWAEDGPDDADRRVFGTLDIADDALQAVIRRAHRNQYVAEAGEITFRDGPMPQPPETAFVVAKPPAWQAAERQDGYELDWLVSVANCTPAEAFDFYKTDIQNFTPEQWAAKRDREDEAIRKNARQARQKIAATFRRVEEAQEAGDD